MYTYRWQRRLLGAFISTALTVLSIMLFDTYNTKMASYFIYGALVFVFALSSICLFISGFWYAAKNFKLGRKSLLKRD